MPVGAMFQAAFQTPALPLFHAAMRVLSLPPPEIGAVCDRQWTIARAVQGHRRQAVFLPGQLERVLEVQEDTTLPHELCRVNAGPVEHGETRAYLLRNALIQDGMLYKGSYRAKLLLSGGRDLPRPPTVVTERSSLAVSAMGNRYFAHWLIDDCTRQRAIAVDPDSLGRPHAIAREMSRHELEYSDLLGFSPTPVGNAFFSELVVLDDRGQNRFKRARYEWMRNTLLRAVGLPPEPPSHPGVFVVRGTAGAPTGPEERERACAAAGMDARVAGSGSLASLGEGDCKGLRRRARGGRRGRRFARPTADPDDPWYRHDLPAAARAVQQ
jgi:hypothetical protein